MIPVVTFKSFQGVKSPEFKGTVDLIEAKAWLKDIERAFALAKVSDEQKTEFSSYFPKSDDASYWWESTKALEAEDVVSWERFTNIFLDKYCPKYMQS